MGIAATFLRLLEQVVRVGPIRLSRVSTSFFTPDKDINSLTVGIAAFEGTESVSWSAYDSNDVLIAEGTHYVENGAFT